MVQSHCYSKDKITGTLQMGSRKQKNNKAAVRYGFARVGISTPDHNWVFGNDNIVNDEKPMPCSDADSKDIAYVR